MKINESLVNLEQEIIVHMISLFPEISRNSEIFFLFYLLVLHKKKNGKKIFHLETMIDIIQPVSFFHDL